MDSKINKNTILSIIAIVIACISIILNFTMNTVSTNNYRVIIGGEDEVAGYKLKNYDQVLTIVTRIFKENKQGFTMSSANGSYIDDSGRYHGEESFVIDINDIDKNKFLKLLEELKDNLNTGQIMVEEIDKKVYLYPNKPEYEAEPEN